jgi:hypothetical protein
VKCLDAGCNCFLGFTPRMFQFFVRLASFAEQKTSQRLDLLDSTTRGPIALDFRDIAWDLVEG